MGPGVLYEDHNWTCAACEIGSSEHQIPQKGELVLPLKMGKKGLHYGNKRIEGGAGRDSEP